MTVGSEHLWSGQSQNHLPISTRRYARIDRDWAPSIGLVASACGTHSMGPPRFRRSTRKLATCAQSNCCWGTRNWTAPSGISVSSEKMHWPSRKRSKSDIPGHFGGRPIPDTEPVAPFLLLLPAFRTLASNPRQALCRRSVPRTKQALISVTPMPALTYATRGAMSLVWVNTCAFCISSASYFSAAKSRSHFWISLAQDSSFSWRYLRS